MTTESLPASASCNGFAWNTRNWAKSASKILMPKHGEVSSSSHCNVAKNLLAASTIMMWIRKLIIFGSTSGINSSRISISSAMKIPKYKYAIQRFQRRLRDVISLMFPLQLQTPHSEDCLTSSTLYTQCSKTLDVILKLRPESIVDGFMNIWIIKPGSSSRGRGISLDMKLENILSIVNKSSGHQGRYIVQKYIERPFLIYETKFDIRQWFLVTSWNPLNVWMYRDSYLRFCSRPFTLTCGHESIHLCNNAVQARYTNAERSSKLPTDNMWDNKTFIQFLKEQGHGDKWHTLIYPTMKKCLISKLIFTFSIANFDVIREWQSKQVGLVNIKKGNLVNPVWISSLHTHHDFGAR